MPVGPPALGLKGESGSAPCNTADISRLSLVSEPAHRDSVREIVSKHYFLILLINDEEQAEFEELILQNQEYFAYINYALTNAQV
jgi:hypothetical protein